MVLTIIFEEISDPALHSGSRGLTTKGFGNTPPVEILANLQRFYGKPSYQELDAIFLCLNKPMNRMPPVNFMLSAIEEVKLFLLSNPDEDRALTESNLISYALINLTKKGGVYDKEIEKWQKRPPQNRRKWAKLLAHMVKDYERQITETGEPTWGMKAMEQPCTPRRTSVMVNH